MASLKDDVTQKVLDDYTTAPIDDKLKATLGFLRKMTREPEKLAPEDACAVLAAGVSRTALGQAIQVSYLFNIYDRLADTLGWDVPEKTSGAYESGARMLLTRGYR